jgi:hypothetical protein
MRGEIVEERKEWPSTAELRVSNIGPHARKDSSNEMNESPSHQQPLPQISIKVVVHSDQTYKQNE